MKKSNSVKIRNAIKKWYFSLIRLTKMRIDNIWG